MTKCLKLLKMKWIKYKYKSINPILRQLTKELLNYSWVLQELVPAMNLASNMGIKMTVLLKIIVNIKLDRIKEIFQVLIEEFLILIINFTKTNKKKTMINN